MTKTIVRLALAGAAAASFAMPHAASAAEAPCGGTFIVDCLKRTVEEAISVPCIPYGTFEICITAQ